MEDYLLKVNCPINARLELIKAAFASYEGTDNQYIRRELAEGIFWLCDGIKEELETSNHPSKDYCIGYLASLTDMGADVFKSGGTPEELHRIDELCIKVATCSTDNMPPT